MKKLENEEWYKKLTINNGIWIDQGINIQNIIKADNITVYDSNEEFNGLAYNVKDSKYEVIKLIGTEEIMEDGGMY